ncbi:MAG: glutamate ABC transporter substrate-binding protein [Propionibacteriaceae bacterium]|nr:glutamate ABC transporter substrate-binding protein [Propionibacteriaceae bacterium]
MKHQKKMFASLAALGLTVALSACNTTPGATPAGPGGDGGDGEGGGGGTVNIGIKYDQPGLGLKEGENYTGFDVEVANYVANELGYDNVNFIETPSPQREAMLQGGQVEMIFATYSITDSRKERVSFAGPYFIAGQDLLVQEGSDITGPDAMDGKRLCSVTGSTPAQRIKDEYSQGVQLQEFDTYTKCVDALNSGTVDAVTTDNVILAGYAAQDQYAGSLKLVGQPFSEEKYGVGIAKGDVELCERINAALTKMVDSGEWENALEKTVGPSGFQFDTATNPPQHDACS